MQCRQAFVPVHRPTPIYVPTVPMGLTIYGILLERCNRCYTTNNNTPIATVANIDMQ